MAKSRNQTIEEIKRVLVEQHEQTLARIDALVVTPDKPKKKPRKRRASDDDYEPILGEQ